MSKVTDQSGALPLNYRLGVKLLIKKVIFRENFLDDQNDSMQTQTASVSNSIHNDALPIT